jgi:hypothetical protein
VIFFYFQTQGDYRGILARMYKKCTEFLECTKMYIPIKMEDFFDAEISIYSAQNFFIYLFEDFIQRFSNETPCP